MELLFGGADPASERRPGGVLQSTALDRDLARLTRFRSTPFSFRSAPPSSAPGHSWTVRILILNEGTVRFEQWKTSLVAQPGDILVIPDWISFQLDAPGELDALLVEVPAWWAARELIPADLDFRSLIAAGFFTAGALRCLAASLYDLESSPEYCAKALAMFGNLVRQSLSLARSDESSTPAAMVGRVGRISRVLTFIYQHIDTENLTPQAAARALKCSVRTIHKTCSDAGTSFNHMLTDARLSYSAHRLATTSDRISEVAYSAGFVSLSHFCRLFKMRFGVSAGVYRRK